MEQLIALLARVRSVPHRDQFNPWLENLVSLLGMINLSPRNIKFLDDKLITSRREISYFSMRNVMIPKEETLAFSPATLSSLPASLLSQPENVYNTCMRVKIREMTIEDYDCHLFVLAENHDAIAFWKRIGWQQRVDLVVMSQYTT